MKKTITSRIGKKFSEEIEEIKDERLKNKIDKKRISTKILTNLFIRHLNWKKIKEDSKKIYLNKIMKKNGSAVIQGFAIIFLSFFVALFLGIAVFSFNLTTEVLSQDVDIGQTNLKTITEGTFGQINTAMLNNADLIGVIILFMMCFTMMINGFFTASRSPKIFFVIDFLLLVLFFIPSIYVSQIYEIFINSTDLFEDVFINKIANTSKFMLNLPQIIAVTGLITMVLSYSGLRRSDEKEGLNIQGFS